MSTAALCSISDLDYGGDLTGCWVFPEGRLDEIGELIESIINMAWLDVLVIDPRERVGKALCACVFILCRYSRINTAVTLYRSRNFLQGFALTGCP